MNYHTEKQHLDLKQREINLVGHILFSSTHFQHQIKKKMSYYIDTDKKEFVLVISPRNVNFLGEFVFQLFQVTRLTKSLKFY